MRHRLFAKMKVIMDPDSFVRNKEEATLHNVRLLKVSLISSVLVFGIALIGCFIFENQSYMKLPYVCVIVLCAALLLALRFSKKTIGTAYIYIVFLLLVSYSIITSAFVSKDYICVTILIYLFQFPVLYLDKGWRIDLAVFLSGLLYLLVISPFKSPNLMPDEIVNVCVFVILGCIIGTFTRKAQFENFDMKRSLGKMVYVDQLTDLPNRRSFFELLESFKKKDCRKPATALAMIDIDHFKDYNDTHGHQSGDECLRRLGECCESFRETYGLGFYRYGGEEFIAISGEYSQERFLELCELFRQSVELLRIENLDGSSAGITVSIGAAFFSSQEEKKHEKLISDADKALYAAKKSGRNRIERYRGTADGAESCEENLPVSFRQRQ